MRSPFWPYFSRSFPKVDFLMHFGRPLAHLWLPFRSPWLPFGSLWLTFGSLWLTFGSLCLPVGSLLVSFGSLLVSPGFIFSYFCVFSLKMSCKIVFYVFFIEKYILSQPNRTFPKRAERTPKESTSSLVTSPKGPRAERLPQAT